MKRFGLYLFYGLLMLAFESVFRMPGDFLMLAVVFFGFYENFLIGFFLSLLFGFLMDVASFAPAGATLFSYGILFLLIRFLKSKIVFRSVLSRFFWLALFGAACAVSRWVFANLLEEAYRPILIFLPGILVNAVFGLFWIPLLEWYQGLAERETVASQELLLKRGGVHGTDAGLLTRN